MVKSWVEYEKHFDVEIEGSLIQKLKGYCGRNSRIIVVEIKGLLWQKSKAYHGRI